MVLLKFVSPRMLHYAFSDMTASELHFLANEKAKQEACSKTALMCINIGRHITLLSEPTVLAQSPWSDLKCN